jgi:hypothetical protein
MKFLKLDLTSPQKLKLRKGMKIRINKKMMNGEGIGLIVEPLKYDAILKSFDSDRGMMFQLTPDEIEVNEEPEMIEDEEVKEEIEGNGLFKKAKKQARRFGRSKAGKQASRIIKRKGIEALEGMGAHMEGEGLHKKIKKIGRSKVAKQASRIIKRKAVEKLEGMGYHGEGAHMDGEGAHMDGEGIKKAFKKVKKGAKKAGKKISKASKQVGRQIRAIDKKDIENAIKKAGKFYKENIKDTEAGEQLRNAVREGSKAGIMAGISAISAYPPTASLGPPLMMVFEQYGDEGIDYAIEKIGLGLRAGAGLRASGDGLRAGAGLRASGDGLRAGAGLRASGDGLRAGAGVELQDRATIPNFLLKKQKSINIQPSKISKEKEGSGVHVMGAGQIFGNQQPPSARLPKPRKIIKTTNLNKSV